MFIHRGLLRACAMLPLLQSHMMLGGSSRRWLQTQRCSPTWLWLRYHTETLDLVVMDIGKENTWDNSYGGLAVKNDNVRRYIYIYVNMCVYIYKIIYIYTHVLYTYTAEIWLQQKDLTAKAKQFQQCQPRLQSYLSTSRKAAPVGWILLDVLEPLLIPDYHWLFIAVFLCMVHQYKIDVCQLLIVLFY